MIRRVKNQTGRPKALIATDGTILSVPAFTDVVTDLSFHGVMIASAERAGCVIDEVQPVATVEHGEPQAEGVVAEITGTSDRDDTRLWLIERARSLGIKGVRNDWTEDTARRKIQEAEASEATEATVADAAEGSGSRA